jgi:hypothetical protein
LFVIIIVIAFLRRGAGGGMARPIQAKPLRMLCRVTEEENQRARIAPGETDLVDDTASQPIKSSQRQDKKAASIAQRRKWFINKIQNPETAAYR